MWTAATATVAYLVIHANRRHGSELSLPPMCTEMGPEGLRGPTSAVVHPPEHGVAPGRVKSSEASSKAHQFPSLNQLPAMPMNSCEKSNAFFESAFQALRQFISEKGPGKSCGDFPREVQFRNSPGSEDP